MKEPRGKQSKDLYSAFPGVPVSTLHLTVEHVFPEIFFKIFK